MGFFRDMLGLGLVYGAAKSGAERALENEARRAAKRQRGSVPFETTVKVSIPVDEDFDPDDIPAFLSSLEIDAPPGVSIDSISVSASLRESDGEEDWTRPPIYDEKGREIDEEGFPVSPLERDYRAYRRSEVKQKKR